MHVLSSDSSRVLLTLVCGLDGYESIPFSLDQQL